MEADFNVWRAVLQGDFTVCRAGLGWRRGRRLGSSRVVDRRVDSMGGHKEVEEDAVCKKKEREREGNIFRIQERAKDREKSDKLSSVKCQRRLSRSRIKFSPLSLEEFFFLSLLLNRCLYPSCLSVLPPPPPHLVLRNHTVRCSAAQPTVSHMAWCPSFYYAIIVLSVLLYLFLPPPL